MRLILLIIFFFLPRTAIADFNSGDVFGKGMIVEASGTVVTGGGRVLNFASGTTVSVVNNAYQITASGSGGSSATLVPASGGTGVSNNNSSTIKISGNYGLTLTLSNTTSVTLPTSGTLAILGANTFTGDQTLSTHNIITDTSTGTDFATTTSQKIAFYGATPIVQPTGNICTAMANLGLVSSCTESGGGAVSSVASVGGTYDPTVTPTTGAVTVAENSFTKTILAVASANLGGGT